LKMDLYLFQTINDLVGKWFWLDFLVVFFADWFGYILILSLLLIILLKSKWRMFLQASAASILSRFIIVEVIYWLWHRARPFVNNSVNLLIEHSETASFPSGHASFYFAIASAVFFKNKKLGSLFLLGALLISLSRVFAGIHWPTDVLAGAVIGIFSGWLIVKFGDKVI